VVFWFERFWVKVPGFHEVVQQAWNKPVTGRSPLNILHYRLQNTTRELKTSSRKLFGNARRDLHPANEIIQRLEVAQESRPLLDDEQKLRKDLKSRVLGLAAVERSRRRQASRLLWLKEGDACTRFSIPKQTDAKERTIYPALKMNMVHWNGLMTGRKILCICTFRACWVRNCSAKRGLTQKWCTCLNCRLTPWMLPSLRQR
jgi:hypothetical protein